jgi:hypothetical protein
MAFHTPAVWGTGTWTVVHTAALVYSEPYTGNELENYEKAMTDWFMSLPYVLPCRSCGQHCYAYVHTHPPPVKGTVGTRALFDWTVDFHNSVNERTGKRVISKEEAYTSLMTRINDLPTAVELHRNHLARVEDTAAFKAEKAMLRQRNRRNTLVTRAVLVCGFLLAILLACVLVHKK